MGDTSAMKYAKKKWSEPKKSPAKKSVVAEKFLQSFADDYLKIHRIRFFRIEDNFFKWVNGSPSVPRWVKAFVNGMFGGYPDNTCFIRINDRYSLTLNLELKTEDSKGRAVGSLHGKQKANAKSQGWIVARNNNSIQEAVDKFTEHAQMFKELLDFLSIEEIYNHCKNM